MLTDSEVDTLARAILTRIVEDPRASLIFHDVIIKGNDEPVPVYGATSEQGYGSFLCEFMPLAAIKQIIIGCEKLFDAFTIHLSDTESGDQVEKKLNIASSAEDRKFAIKTMAECAS